MTGLKGSYTVRPRASTVPAEIPKADAVLICVNAYSTAEAAQAASIVLKDNGYDTIPEPGSYRKVETPVYWTLVQYRQALP